MVYALLLLKFITHNHSFTFQIFLNFMALALALALHWLQKTVFLYSLIVT